MNAACTRREYKPYYFSRISSFVLFNMSETSRRRDGDQAATFAQAQWQTFELLPEL